MKRVILVPIFIVVFVLCGLYVLPYSNIGVLMKKNTNFEQMGKAPEKNLTVSASNLDPQGVNSKKDIPATWETARH